MSKNFILMSLLCDKLESTDAAPEPASDAVAHVSVRVYVFFFFFSDSRRTGLIRPKSGCFGYIRLYQPTADTAETGWKRLKHAEIGLEYGRKSQNLPSSFFFLWIKAH